MLITPKVFVINLERTPERWKSISERCKKIGQQIERVVAVDGNDINFVPRSSFDIRNKYHEACYLSHRNIWSHAIENNIEFICILEDDVYVVQLIKFIEMSKTFDILYINDRICKDVTGAAVNGCGTDGYIVSICGCRKLLKICSDIDVPLDLRIQAHAHGFIRSKHGLCQKNGTVKFSSGCYPDVVIDAYKSKVNYVEHNDSFKSYIRP